MKSRNLGLECRIERKREKNDVEREVKRDDRGQRDKRKRGKNVSPICK